MGLWQRLFRPRAPAPAAPTNDHSVLIHFQLSADGFGSPDERPAYFDLQERIEKAINNAKAGELDGDEWGGGECVVFTYGPDAGKLWAAIRPALDGFPIRPGSYAIIRAGRPDSPETRVDLP